VTDTGTVHRELCCSGGVLVCLFSGGEQQILIHPAFLYFSQEKEFSTVFVFGNRDGMVYKQPRLFFDLTNTKETVRSKTVASLAQTLTG